MISNIQDALGEANRWLDSESVIGVEGVGQGLKDGKDCIVVFVSRPPSEISGEIPNEFQGIPVVIEESGKFGIQ